MEVPATSNGEPVRFVLWPHRALGQAGTARLLAGVAMAMVIPAVVPAAYGLWPVAGMLVLAYVAFAAAILASNRQAHTCQIIEVDGGKVQVIAGNGRQHRPVAAFDAYWTRVDLASDHYLENRLHLRQSSRSIEIGHFLSPPEREDLAQHLRAALARLRTFG